MATTSFLYHTLGLVGYKHLRTEYRQGHVYHHVRLRRHERRCRHCRARWQQLRLAGGFVREFRALPVGARAQWVVLHGHRQYCPKGKGPGSIKLDFYLNQLLRLKSVPFGPGSITLERQLILRRVARRSRLPGSPR